MRIKETDVKANCAEKQRLKSGVNIFWIVMIHRYYRMRLPCRIIGAGPAGRQGLWIEDMNRAGMTRVAPARSRFPYFEL